VEVRISVLTPDNAQEPDVLLAITTCVTEGVLCGLELAYASAGHPPRIIVVAERIEPRQLARAMNAGLIFLLDRRTTGYNRIAEAILAAASVTTLRAGQATTAVSAGR